MSKRDIIATILIVAGVVGFVLLMSGCVSQRTVVGGEETCVESRALLFTSVKCSNNDEVTK